jgi:hypothetical protein
MAEDTNFKYKYPGYLSNQETITSAKLNSIISAINTLTENLMKHDHLGDVVNANGETTRGPRLIGYSCLVEQTVNRFCLTDKAVNTDKLENDAVTTEKVKDFAITTTKILDQNITNDKIKDLTITRNKLIDRIITSDKIDPSVFNEIFDMIYPVGSTFISFEKTQNCPLPRGNWERITVDQNRVLQIAKNYNDANNTLNAGLPNIYGEYYDLQGNTGHKTGAFSSSTTRPYSYSNSSGSDKHIWLIFDASKSNSIYGQSNTVQPPAILINAWKRIPDNTKSIIILSSQSDALIQLSIDGGAYENFYGEVHKNLTFNSTDPNKTYSYTISKNGYISESGSGIIGYNTNNIYIETTLQVQALDITLYNPSQYIYNVYTIPIKKTGTYQIELAGGKSTRGGNEGYTGKGGKAILDNLQLSNGDEIKFYTIKAGSTSYATGGVGVGVKLNNQWLCVVGGAGAWVMYGSLWDGNFDAVGGGGYVGGNAINATRVNSPGYSAYNNGGIGDGTGNTNGSGYSITSDYGKGYGGTGYIDSNYTSYATLVSNTNNGDAYIKYRYIGQ